MVGQGEEDVLLATVADEKTAQRRVFELGMSLLNTERTPVEAAALQFSGSVRDDVAVLFAGEKREVREVNTRYGSLDRSRSRTPL